MNKVVNSVQQILSECKSMIEQTDDCEFFDVNSLACTLKEQCNELKELFDESPEKERDIITRKALVENTALRLEFYMDVRMGLYSDRRKLRKFAETLYNDLRGICSEIAMRSGDYQDAVVVEWGTRTRWAIDFYARSQHIIFETDAEDEETIKTIVEEMKKFKEGNKCQETDF